MTVRSITKYKQISAAMLSVILFACFSIVAVRCSLPSALIAQGQVEQNAPHASDSCPVANQGQSLDYSECCCSLTALVKGDTPKLPDPAVLINVSVDLDFVDPVIVGAQKSYHGRLPSDKSSPPIYLATQRLRI